MDSESEDDHAVAKSSSDLSPAPSSQSSSVSSAFSMDYVVKFATFHALDWDKHCRSFFYAAAEVIHGFKRIEEGDFDFDGHPYNIRVIFEALNSRVDSIIHDARHLPGRFAIMLPDFFDHELIGEDAPHSDVDK